MSSPAGTTTVVIPRPRTPEVPAAPQRRHRPPTQYWDVFEACWRTAPGGPPAP